MADSIETRKKSPRAPTIALDEALDRTLKIYDKDRLHAIPTEIAAKHMGYANANNGAALQCLASLRYYGLLERPRDGFVAVSKDVEAYKFAPSEDMRKAFLRRFVSTPPLFAELLDRAQAGMPSDESLRYDLIQRGFIPGSATTVGTAFKRSIEFSDVLNTDRTSAISSVPIEAEPSEASYQATTVLSQGATNASDGLRFNATVNETEHDRIPVRLSGGRRAWLLIPELFFERDKERLKAQIDLLLTQDEEGL